MLIFFKNRAKMFLLHQPGARFLKKIQLLYSLHLPQSLSQSRSRSSIKFTKKDNLKITSTVVTHQDFYGF